MNWMVLPNQVCLIVKLYNNRPELLPDSNDSVHFALISAQSIPLQRPSKRTSFPVFTLLKYVVYPTFS